MSPNTPEMRFLFDCESCTHTYLIWDSQSREAVVIDPVLEQLERDTLVITELGLRLRYVLDTHIHADHLSSLGKLREKFGCRTGMSLRGGADCTDLKLTEGQTLTFGEHTLTVLETPGHTSGCLSFLVGHWVFTGDALMIRGCGRTDFQEGNAETLYQSVTKKLFTLPDDTIVYPAHDYKGLFASTIGEEKQFNPRLTKNQQDFVAFMKSLRLADPKMISVAVPTNLKCGKVS